MSAQLDAGAIFDVQIKRLHEYKRQLLNALHIVHLWTRARKDPKVDHPSRARSCSARRRPGYRTAKLIIRLINGIGEVVNSEAERTGLRVAFVPNYRVSLAERIIPAADVSEQISTAGMEASGTGNMKFAMNGALTIGTLDGANIEIRELVGAEDNFFLFGQTAEEVKQKLNQGYRGRAVYESNAAVREVLDLIGSGFFSPEDRRPFQPTGRIAARRRPLPGARRLRRVRQGPRRRGPRVFAARSLVEVDSAQCRAHGLFLV